MRIDKKLGGNELKKIPQLIIGHWIYTFGISLIILSNLGAGSWDTIMIALSEKVGWTIGTWSLIIQFCLIFVAAFIVKEKVQWKSIYGIILGSIAIDFWMVLVFSEVTVTSMLLRIGLFVLGIVILGFGIAIYIRTNVFTGPIDSLMLAVSKRFKLSVRMARLSIEVFAAITGFLLGGPVGLGTVIVAFVLGYSIQFSMEGLEKVKKKWELKILI